MLRKLTLLAVLVVLVIAAVLTGAGNAFATVNPPSWARQPSVCKPVQLADSNHPSGISGPLARGYNVYSLKIIYRTRISCSEARRLARQDWVYGHRYSPLDWHLFRSWYSSAGAGYVGNYYGTDGYRGVEYLAVH